MQRRKHAKDRKHVKGGFVSGNARYKRTKPEHRRTMGKATSSAAG